MRAYSRLNWLGLSYPTSKAAVVTEAPPVLRSRLASSRRVSDVLDNPLDDARMLRYTTCYPTPLSVEVDMIFSHFI